MSSCAVYDREYVTLIMSGPIVILELQGEDALQRWLDVLGPSDSATARGSAPYSLRARFGTG